MFSLKKIFTSSIQIAVKIFFLMFQVTQFQHDLVPNRQQAITWTSDDLFRQSMYVSSGLYEF